MDTSCLYYICLISSLHCLIVTWLVVAIETPTTESYENFTATDNSSFSGTSEIYKTTKSIGPVKEATIYHVTTDGKETLDTTADSDQDTATPTAGQELSTVHSGLDIITPSGGKDTTSVNGGKNITKTQASSVKSPLDFMPSCPPPNNLHQICNVSLGNITCNERAVVIKLCYHRYTRIYVNSSWDVCISVKNLCQDVVNFLVKEKLVSQDDIPSTTSDRYYSTENVYHSTESFTQEVTQNPFDKVTSVKHSKVEATTLDNKGPVMASTPDISDSGSSVASSHNISSTTSTPVADESNSHDIYPSHALSWLYPLIGCLVILLEIIILWYFFWYRKKKYGSSPVGRYRRASTGSMVIQEDVIEPESTSPTKALFVNTEFNEDSATKEDEKIFNSYLNLRFMDDSSMEGTPERVLIK